MEGQSFFMNQNAFDLDFRDPMVDLIELLISDPMKVPYFIHSSIYTSEYDFLKAYLLLLICFSYFLLSSDRNKVITVLKLLRWLLWKSTFT
jgi:hypothetical protein